MNALSDILENHYPPVVQGDFVAAQEFARAGLLAAGFGGGGNGDGHFLIRVAEGDDGAELIAHLKFPRNDGQGERSLRRRITHASNQTSI